MIYLTPLLTTLAYLMGERSVVTATVAPRTDFIQAALEDSYHAYPWRFARRQTAIVPVFTTNNTYSVACPATFDYEMKCNAFYLIGTSQIDMVEIDSLDKGSHTMGSNVFWITTVVEGAFIFNTYESQASINFVYQNLPPILDVAGTIGSAYPSKMTIAKGARIYVKLGQNPDADVSQEEAQYSQAISNDIATNQVPAPRRPRRTVAGNPGSF